MELELTEPSLFLDCDPRAPARFAAALATRLAREVPRRERLPSLARES